MVLGHKPASAPPAWTLAALLLVLSGCSTAKVTSPAAATPAVAQCPVEGRWVTPPASPPLPTAAFLERLGAPRVLLLGEDHDRADDHRWQLQTIAALGGRQSELVLAFEMLPRSSQPALDEWSAGALDVDEFVRRSRWFSVWGYPPELYMPVLHLGRMNRYPLVALNVDRSMLRMVSGGGWNSVPLAQREGISDPAPPSAGYREMLREVFAAHAGAEPTDSEALENFIDAQLTWDRAFAQGIRDALERHPDATVVALIGRGHLEYGYGVAHQLDDLGVTEHVTLLPKEVSPQCGDALEVGLADAVFGIRRNRDEPHGVKLGVFLEPAAAGVRIRRVLDGSVADAAGLAVDDVVVAAAGRRVATVAEIKAVLAKQPPGTVLPLQIERGSERIEIDARFPPRGQ